ncbi:uncharacterized protein UTRI_01585 [Ustilago trichophora]|uniref:PXA domain-containing protein n=1 Tax=Ustilago trichophora TaxID=86804 RepID=A0A5C3E044_9BASI|nr:uncharacterized protein UTRI_01585 [Ustilago trichophora]
MSQSGQADQPAAVASVAQDKPPSPLAAPLNNSNLFVTALTVGLGLALLTIGLWNAILVVAVAMLLICNPWVRTLLELPSTDGKRELSRFDPARYLLSYTSGSASETSDASQGQDDDLFTASPEVHPLMQTEQLYSLTVMPDALRESSQTMIRFVIRDFVQGWYDNLTFAHPNFPISAEASISHTAASIYLRSRQLKSANTAAEILLTVQSVVLSSLRRRRTASSARSTWPSTAARVDALRKAVVQTIGDPDFINQKIVEFAEPASETSLEGQAISSDELERLKSLDTAALDTQLAEQPASADYPVRLTSASVPRPRPGSTDLSEMQSAASSRNAPTQASRQHSPEALARQNPAPMQSSAMDSRTSQGSALKPAGPSGPPRPRVTPPKKSNSSGPFSALGGFATGALGVLADAAERAVDVVGGTVDEFGNLLMVPAEPSTRNQTNVSANQSVDGTNSPRRRYAVLAEREQDDASPSRGSQNPHASGHLAKDSSAPAYHLDVPSSFDEPPLPESLRQSLRNIGSARAFDISDTPERRSEDAPSIVAPAPVAAALTFPTHDSFSIDERQEDEQASLISMHALLSDRTSQTYEAFENFLEQPGNRFCAPNEGELLLRLHTQLNTLASIMEFATLDEQTFRADASTILSKALEQLPSTLPPTHDGQRPVLVRRSAQQVLTNLEWCANMDVVEPLRENIIARLVQLHDAFMVSSGASAPPSQPQSEQSSPSKTRFSATVPRTESPEPNQLRAFLDRENRPSFSSMDSERAAFRYEPRRKTTAPNSMVNSLQPGAQTPPRAPSVPPGPGGAPVMGPPSGPSRPMSVPPRVPSAPPRSQQMAVPGTSAPAVAPPSQVQRSSTDLSPIQAHPRISIDVNHPPSSSSSSTVISVTDISPNAESSKSVDLRTFEVMISVEGGADPSDAASITSPDGFVLVRRWHEFEQMDAQIQRQPRSSNPLPRLPAVKGKRSAELCRLLEAYVFELLLPANKAQLAGVAGAKRFFDRTRAGASAEDLRRKGGPGAFLGGIGKGIVSGVGMVGKQAAKTSATGIQALSASTGGARNGLEAPSEHASPLRPGSTPDAPDGLATRFAPSSPVIDSASSTTSAFVSRTNSPSPSPSRRPRDAALTHPSTSTTTSELSTQHLDMLLSSIFAVADEAFNLQGGWTLRRGMLRVLEQVVRTTYASSIVAGFNNSAAGLNVNNFAKWIGNLTDTMWPDGRRWGSEIGTPDEKQPRTEEEKRKTADKAREIVVSYAPAQAGYLLGPGGKVACVKALAEVHATLMDPITACDLGLTAVLKALDMASR